MYSGCDTYFGVIDQAFAHNMYPNAPDYTWRFDGPGTTAFGVGYPNNVNASRERCMAPGNTCTWAHDLWTAEALRVLGEQADAEALAAATGAAAPPPLFLYLAYTDPHAGGWAGTEEAGNPVPSDAGRVDYSKEAWPLPERDHASVIANFLDADVGKVVALLEARGMRTGTAVAFASDNGASNEGNHDYMFFESSGPLRGFKRCLTEGGIRTPFAVSWPGTVAPGVSAYPVAFWDWLPTVADLGGLPPSAWPANLDGVSFKAELLGLPQQPHPPLYWEFCTDTLPPGAPRRGKGWRQAVRNGTWKGVSFFSADDTMALYDLSTDPSEASDESKKHPEMVAAMMAFAKAAHVESPVFPSGDKACRSS